MRLYYFTEQRWAEKILLEQRFKLSTIGELNDPFELLGAVVGAKKARRAYQVLHRHWSKTIGLLCASRSWESPVMWAHYGHKHQGVCLGFDVIDAEVHKVGYRAGRLKGMLEKIGTGELLLEQQFRAILTTKFKDWEYERESRLFASLDVREPQDGKYYLNFEPHIVLREVILGARCVADIGSFGEKVVPSKASIEVFRARPAFNSFRIVRQQNEPSIFVPAAPHAAAGTKVS
ncbi:DUF2971 domain-containing protein [Achromobacter aloeverae]